MHNQQIVIGQSQVTIPTTRVVDLGRTLRKILRHERIEKLGAALKRGAQHCLTTLAISGLMLGGSVSLSGPAGGAWLVGSPSGEQENHCPGHRKARSYPGSRQAGIDLFLPVGTQVQLGQLFSAYP